MERTYRIGGEERSVRLEREGEVLIARVGARVERVSIVRAAPGTLVLRLGEDTWRFVVARTRAGLEVAARGRHVVLEDPAASPAGAPRGGPSDGRVTTPMPGKIVAVHVAEGDRVEAGRALVVLESMKMQNDVAATTAGVVARIHHAVGDNVEYGDVLVEIEADAGVEP